MRGSVRTLGVLFLSLATLFFTGQSLAADTYKVGVVTFLSGGAAGPFGVPAKNAADVIVEALNAGTVPAPYTTKGFAGKQIEMVLIDEAGGATEQVTEFRNLVQQKKVDAVIGYISSGHCLAIAPVAEELKALTVLFDCGTPRIFEEASYTYVFRTGPTATIDNVGAARYILDMKADLKGVSGINQDYAWGHDSWNDFISTLKVLKPDVEVKNELFPKLFKGQYGAEISSLTVNKADFIHSSFWGGDMEAFVLQGSARGLFDDQPGVLTTGETAMFRLDIPEGTIIGGRGPFGVFAPESALNSWFRENYIKRFDTPPTYPSYKMAQAFLGLKTAIEKAAAAKADFTTADVIKAFENLEFEAPSGTVMMKIGKGHQAVQGTAYGQFTKKDGKPTVKNVKRFSADCVSPPDGISSADWIKGGMKGAKCE
ncbi:MAG: ABC transporter substrate-binding protein [Deltaproteobacteria bacterium]|nr:ABC transporter substrate-binding protein [Deltaproteobacteria bacterium]NIS77107.1 ABC transporter substrate-binding protein [Deltaproteobacteria bacterium]